jgi:GntR family transcriptional regulator
MSGDIALNTRGCLKTTVSAAATLLFSNRTQSKRRTVLDKQSPIPLYYQLAESLRERITAGELQPGEQLPAERELGDQAGISRMTARQAIAYLVREGMLEVKPGVGTFVASPKLTHHATHLLGFTEEIMGQGGRAHSRVLEQSVGTPPPRVAHALGLPAAAATVKIVRLRLADGIPMLLETSHIPAQLCPGLENAALATQSLYTLLRERYQLPLQRAHQTLEATIANEYEASLFGMRPGAAMILVEGVAYRENSQPVEHFKAIYRGDRFRFALESQRDVWSMDWADAPSFRVEMR